MPIVFQKRRAWYLLNGKFPKTVTSSEDRFRSGKIDGNPARHHRQCYVIASHFGADLALFSAYNLYPFYLIFYRSLFFWKIRFIRVPWVNVFFFECDQGLERYWTSFDNLDRNEWRTQNYYFFFWRKRKQRKRQKFCDLHSNPVSEYCRMDQCHHSSDSSPGLWGMFIPTRQASLLL